MDAPSRLYPRVPPIAWVISGIVLVIAAIVVVLSVGREPPLLESAGDLTYLEGKGRPDGGQQGGLVASIADVTEAEVSRTGSELTLLARVVAELPQPLKVSALEFRWDLTAEDGSTWTVLTSIGKEAQTSVYSSSGFGAGTVDDTLLGGVEVLGNEVEVRFDVADMPDFPETFEWSLTTTLRAFRNEPDSPRVEDRFPDAGTEVFEG